MTTPFHPPEYVDLAGDEVLPLGQEFQEFVSCFVDSSERPLRRLKCKEKYRYCSKLVLKLQ